MLDIPNTKRNEIASLDLMDRATAIYLILPLVIFLLGWFEWWAALGLMACVAYSLRALWADAPARAIGYPPTRLKLTVAIAVGCGWAVFGGAGHLLFANADWHMRDAVLHDLVVSPWPVGYGPLDGRESLLRAAIGFYMPAALLGKWLGLTLAHTVMGMWTALGASLFLLQVLSLLPSRGRLIFLAALVIVLFSGLDIIGNIINIGPRFIVNWKITQHIEWWAETYQYSSMTTQLFWVPNHALAAWLIVGLMARNPRYCALDTMLPLLVITSALWSPLSAIGVVPFVLCRALQISVKDRQWRILHFKNWLPVLPVGLVIGSYLILDPGGIDKGISVGKGDFLDTALKMMRQAQFFLLEAGFIGFAVLMIRRSNELILALVLLALLPLAHLGPGNDLVMRASIPSLAVLAIDSCLALARNETAPGLRRKKIVLACLLAIGAVTPIQEFARAILLPAWPLDLHATLIGVNCGKYPAHYVARIDSLSPAYNLLLKPHSMELDALNLHSCDNPAFDLMIKAGIL